MSKTTQPPKAPSDTLDIQESGYKTSYTAIRKARRFAVQGLYEWLCTDEHFKQLGHQDWLGNTTDVIAARTRSQNAMHTVHLGYYHTLMRDIPIQKVELNSHIQSVLDRDITRLDKVEYAVLLIGTYELLHSAHIPYKVVIDEAILLNTHFAATDSFKLINALMDKLAKQIRTQEINGNQKTAPTPPPQLG